MRIRFNRVLRPWAVLCAALPACDHTGEALQDTRLLGTHRLVRIEDNVETPPQQPADVTAVTLCASTDAGPSPTEPCWVNGAEFDFNAQHRFRFSVDFTREYERLRAVDLTSRGTFFVGPTAGALQLSYDGAPQWSAILYRPEQDGGIVLTMTSAFANGIFGRTIMRGTLTRLYLRPR